MARLTELLQLTEQPAKPGIRLRTLSRQRSQPEAAVELV
jgi:hypothetical protein